jgi:prepilin-type N-terminal cleavage/methylation domain-containing protein
MKFPQPPSRLAKAGFTLVELLVVIGIIAILATVTLSVGSSVIRAAKRAKAANTATQIQTACMNYYTEYSVYPIPSTATASKDYEIRDTSAGSDATGGVADDTAWGYLICSLCGNINPSTGISFTTSTVANTRNIAFLSMKSSDVDAKGTPLNPLATGTSIYFDIAIDGDYDGILGVGSSSVTDMPNFSATTFNAAAQAGGGQSTAGVAVWANCNSTTTTASSPNFWVHTF